MERRYNEKNETSVVKNMICPVGARRKKNASPALNGPEETLGVTL
jgi:hypothetical protein